MNLVYSRNRPVLNSSEQGFEAVFVTMLETTGQSNLLHVHQECEDFNVILPDSVQRNLLNTLLKIQVLERL